MACISDAKCVTDAKRVTDAKTVTDVLIKTYLKNMTTLVITLQKKKNKKVDEITVYLC